MTNIKFNYVKQNKVGEGDWCLGHKTTSWNIKGSWAKSIWLRKLTADYMKTMIRAREFVWLWGFSIYLWSLYFFVDLFHFPFFRYIRFLREGDQYLLLNFSHYEEEHIKPIILWYPSSNILKRRYFLLMVKKDHKDIIYTQKLFIT